MSSLRSFLCCTTACSMTIHLLGRKLPIVGALLYFNSAVDAVPDFIVGVGYSDDSIVLAAAAATVAAHIKPEHRQRAKEWVDGQFGPEEEQTTD